MFVRLHDIQERLVSEELILPSQLLDRSPRENGVARMAAEILQDAVDIVVGKVKVQADYVDLPPEVRARAHWAKLTKDERRELLVAEGRRQALEFIASENFSFWATLADIDPMKIQRWARALMETPRAA